MNQALEDLLRSRAGIWRGLHSDHAAWPVVGSGFPELDAVLPGGGWPLGTLAEIAIPAVGCGELRLLLPAMADLSRAGRHIVWIAPPYQPYAPGLLQAGLALPQLLAVNVDTADDLPWSAEKLLRSGGCGMVLLWPHRLDNRQIRRLQLAAETGSALAILFVLPGQSYPGAALRIGVCPSATGLTLNIIKARGSLRRSALTIRF